MGKRILRPGCAGFLAAIAVCAVGGFAFAYSVYNKHNTVYSSSTASSASAVSSQVSSSKARASSEDMETGGLLMLVNAKYSLPDGFSPTLTTISQSYYVSSDKDNRFDTRAAPHLSQMIKDARADGIDLVIYSGYRSHSYQTENFDRHVREYRAKGYGASAASSEAATLVAPPGTSEHETGLAADIVSTDYLKTHSDLSSSFDETDAYTWLSKHAASYGFILRYPEGKTSITGIEYEPWHFRYVGEANAKKIDASGLCLEEYDGKA